MIAAIALASLWQNALICALAWIVATRLNERNASTRYAVWFTALLAMAIVPVLSATSDAGARLLALLPAHGATAVIVSVAPIAGTSFVRDGVWNALQGWIAALWLAGTAVGMMRLMRSALVLRRIRKRARPLADAPGVYVSDDLAVPIATGVLDPKIIVPRSVFDEIPAADLRSIVEHERAHVRRNDVAGTLAQRIVEVLFFFNPWVYVAGRFLVRERENACDDWAAHVCGTPAEYAVTLAALAERLTRRTNALLAPGAIESRRLVVSRIERLIDGGTSRPYRLNYTVIGGTLMLFFALTLALQAVSPALGFNAQTTAATSLVAAACTHPNADVAVTNAVPPDVPEGTTPRGAVEVKVSVDASGHIVATSVIRSSGDQRVDAAVVTAAKASTYRAATHACAASAGSYIFRAQFKPQH